MSAQTEVDETVVEEIAEPLYIGMDVGGTKIQTSLVGDSGKIYDSLKGKTPRGCPPEVTIQEIKDSVARLLEKRGMPLGSLSGIGIAIPGVVEPETGHIVVTPNMNLTGIALGENLREHFGIPVALGNDCNLGTLGEAWQGAARYAKSCVGIFVGTGIGSGIVVDGKLWTGAAYAAGEIGHIVMQVPARSWREMMGLEELKKKKLPVCGCGNLGCLESFASRTAIENAIQEAVAAGIKTKLTELTEGNLSLIRAGTLAKALRMEDKLTTAVIVYTAEVLAYTCLTVRHLLDPEVILLGGGVMEACHRYMMPTIDWIVSQDQLPAADKPRRVVLSALGDDAVVLGAAALARAEVLHEKNVVASVQGTFDYPVLSLEKGSCMVNEVTIESDFMILSDGRVELRSYSRENDEKRTIRRKELMYLCGGAVQQLILTARDLGVISLSKKAAEYLQLRRIEVQILPLEEAVETFNHSSLPRAAIFCLS